MTPEEWQQAKGLFDAVLQRDPADRDAFLAQASGSITAEVRHEVESLLATHQESDSFLETPAAVLRDEESGRSLFREGQTVGRYRVLKILGSGGMGDVYLAEDPRLGRKVALKLLPRDLGADQDRLRRFEQEARTASALSHPNVCVIYEIGETDAVTNVHEIRRFIAMEYVPGESLRALIERHQKSNTRIPLADALRIAQQITAGLEAAHEAGIVHRDIKPENVMIRPDGLVKILDFGLAKLGERPLAARSEIPENKQESLHTEPGIVLGTVQYMSPEQARGLPVDHRTDVWSVGAVLYEMTAGRPAFSGETTSDIIVSVLDREPPPVDATVPADLASLLTKALVKDREFRYQAMTEVSRDLSETRQRVSQGVISPDRGRAHSDRRRRRMIGAAVIVMSILGFGALFASRRKQTANDVDVRTAPLTAALPVRLAVLPFENLGRADDAYFVDGVADELRGKLAALSGVEVIARASSNQYRQTSKPPEQIARELGVRYLLVGTVRWDKGAGKKTAGSAKRSLDRVRVLPELVDVTQGGAGRAPLTKWQQPFDATLAEVFDVQANIAQQVAEALKVSLGIGERSQLASRPTADLAAYDAFLQGEEVSDRMAASDPATLRRASRFYERAIAADSTFAQAWARLAEARAHLYLIGSGAPADTARIRLAAERAVALAPQSPHGRRALGYHYLFVEYNPARAAAELALARRTWANDTELLNATAAAEMSLGRWADAILHLRRAALFDPRSAAVTHALGGGQLWTRQYSNARETLDRGLRLAPANLGILQERTMVELAEGNLSGARAVIRRTPKNVATPELVANFANYWDLSWVLDDAQQRVILGLSPAAFDDNRAAWALKLAEVLALRGDTRRVRDFADSASREFEVQIRASPSDAQLRTLHGVALAYLGRRVDAVLEGRRGAALMPITKNAVFGAYLQHQLARIYILVGEPEKALDQLEPLLKIPYFLSPGWLRIDPTFAPLRGNPRFERLAGGK